LKEAIELEIGKSRKGKEDWDCCDTQKKKGRS